MTHPVRLVAYDPQWPERFQEEAALIKAALGENCLAIHHIGSTSIPGLKAKPIIDILPVVRDILAVDSCNQDMRNLGYEPQGEYGICFRRFFIKGGSQRTHHVHAFEEDSPEINRHLMFRDWLKNHPEDREAYEKIKEELAVIYSNDSFKYTLGKETLINEILSKTGFKGWRIVQVLTPKEQEAARELRRQHFLGKSDSYSLEDDKMNDVHLVFYSNEDIVGYAHIEEPSVGCAIFRVFEMQKESQEQGPQFRHLCERWIYQKGLGERPISLSKS